jgi:hypothetical protein
MEFNWIFNTRNIIYSLRLWLSNFDDYAIIYCLDIRVKNNYI